MEARAFTYPRRQGPTDLMADSSQSAMEDLMLFFFKQDLEASERTLPAIPIPDAKTTPLSAGSAAAPAETPPGAAPPRGSGLASARADADARRGHRCGSSTR